MIYLNTSKYCPKGATISEEMHPIGYYLQLLFSVIQHWIGQLTQVSRLYHQLTMYFIFILGNAGHANINVN